MGGHAFFGGDQNGTAVEDACPVHWWAVSVAMILLYCVVWCLPSCLSCTVGVGTPSQDLDSFSHYNFATDRDMSESAAPTWVLPSNDDLLSSLPTPAHAGFYQAVGSTEVPSKMPAEEDAFAPLPSQYESPASAESTGNFWRYAPTEDVAMPSHRSNVFEEVTDAMGPEAVSLEDLGVDTGLGVFAELWTSIGDTAGDVVEIGFSVLAFLATSGTVLFIANLFQGQGHVGTGPAADAANPLLFTGGLAGSDAHQLHSVNASPARRDTFQSGTSSSPHHVQQRPLDVVPVSSSPFGGASLMLAPAASPLAATSQLAFPAGPPGSLGPHAAATTGSQVVQIGAYYVANVGKDQMVVKTMHLNASQDAVTVQEFVCNSSRSGIVFNGTRHCFDVPVKNLLQGPFAMTAGRAPKHVCHMFESVRIQPPACPTPSRAAEAGIHNRHFDLPSERFKYPSSMRKMVELGFEDNLILRSILTSYGGDVNQALQEFWQE